MEFAIPLSTLDISNVKWAEPRSDHLRKTIQLTYQDNSVCFNNLIIAMQPLRVVEIDDALHQIILEDELGKTTLDKIDQFQKAVSADLEKYSKSSVEIVKSPLQPWLKSGKLSLYLTDKPEQLVFYTNNVLSTFSEKTVKPGDLIRAVVKIQGISLQMSEGDIWTGKSRIQHHILQLYKVSSTTSG
ncbi:MAG: hypothetical protein EB127_21230 [Alphaproteobacteria bacterium]|nr:hypothetical protein [Alphaproteobacteria bacterium]